MGRAPSLVAVLCRATSAARRRTRPGSSTPPLYFHLGSSSEATVLGASPALRRAMRLDEAELPQPTLKAQLTRAPYWLALRTTDSAVCLVMQFWATCEGGTGQRFPSHHGDLGEGYRGQRTAISLARSLRPSASDRGMG